MKKTPGFSKPEISSDFAITVLLIQLEASAIFTLLGGIDPQRATAYLMAVELLDSVRAFFTRRHFDEAEAARATCFAIFNQGYAFDRARLREQCLQFIARCLKREISNIKFHRHKLHTFSPSGVSHPEDFSPGELTESPMPKHEASQSAKELHIHAAGHCPWLVIIL